MTSRIALVASWFLLATSIACEVGSRTSSTLRRSASRFTSFITGNRPYAPVPMMSWRHFQGIFSSIESGVWPEASLNCLDGPFFRSRTSPRSMTASGR